MTAGGETLFAVVDAARDMRLYPLVMESSDQACLFGGEIKEPLKRAAPYIVNLKPDEPLFRAWRDEGRGQSWGIMARSALSLMELRRHFRHFLVAKLPDGMMVQFRFYDPRVFGPYITSCTADELASWFNGVSAFLVENQGLGGFHEFTLRNGQLYDGTASVQ